MKACSLPLQSTEAGSPSCHGLLAHRPNETQLASFEFELMIAAFKLYSVRARQGTVRSADAGASRSRSPPPTARQRRLLAEPSDPYATTAATTGGSW